MMSSPNTVKIIMIEDDEGHARLIEKNIRRAGVTNEIVPFVTGGDALDFMLGKDGSGILGFQFLEKSGDAVVHQ